MVQAFILRIMGGERHFRMHAQWFAHHDRATVLLERGANINCKDINSRTRLSYAVQHFARYKDTERIGRMLLEHGAKR
jgi:hypothetical protein